MWIIRKYFVRRLRYKINEYVRKKVKSILIFRHIISDGRHSKNRFKI